MDSARQEANASSADDPLTLAQALLARWHTQLRRDGWRAAALPSLASAPGLISRYDLRARCIHLGIHRDDDAMSRLMLKYLCTLFGVDRGELLALFRQLLPWSLAHEFAHHLRCTAGCWSGQAWREEMIAHHFARITQQGWPGGQRARLRARLRRSLGALGARLGLDAQAYVNSYAELPLALAGAGLLEMDAARAVQALGAIDPDAADRVLAHLAKGRFDVDRRRAQGETVRAAFDGGTTSPERQLYLHLGWIALALCVEERDYLARWLRTWVPDTLAAGGSLDIGGADAFAAMWGQPPWRQSLALPALPALPALHAVPPSRRSTDVSACWSPQCLADLATLPLRLSASRGDVLLGQGESSNDVFAVLRGSVTLCRAEGPRRLGSGACYGPAGASVSLRADSRVSMAVLRAADLRVFALRHPDTVSALRPWVPSLDNTVQLAALARRLAATAPRPPSMASVEALMEARSPSPDSSAPAGPAPS